MAIALDEKLKEEFMLFRILNDGLTIAGKSLL